jgi:hypothetical protein
MVLCTCAHCYCCAASSDLTEATAHLPDRWDASLTPLRLALLFDFEKYHRCCLYGDSYVTSTAWKKSTTRCNNFIVFQHHLAECVVLRYIV